MGWGLLFLQQLTSSNEISWDKEQCNFIFDIKISDIISQFLQLCFFKVELKISEFSTVCQHFFMNTYVLRFMRSSTFVFVRVTIVLVIRLIKYNIDIFLKRKSLLILLFLIFKIMKDTLAFLKGRDKCTNKYNNAYAKLAFHPIGLKRVL